MILTHWGRGTHICVGELIIIGSDYGLSPGRHQALIWTNVGILLIEPWGTNVSEIFIKIYTFSFKKMRLIVSSAKWRPFCLGLNVLTQCGLQTPCSGLGSRSTLVPIKWCGRHQAITGNITDLFSVRSFSLFWSRFKYCDYVCEMSPSLVRPWCGLT